jgi:hypothetical protein
LAGWSVVVGHTGKNVIVPIRDHLRRETLIRLIDDQSPHKKTIVWHLKIIESMLRRSSDSLFLILKSDTQLNVIFLHFC